MNLAITVGDFQIVQPRVLWLAVAAATWLESLAVASHPLQRHRAETDFRQNKALSFAQR